MKLTKGNENLHKLCRQKKLIGSFLDKLTTTNKQYIFELSYA